RGPGRRYRGAAGRAAHAPRDLASWRVGGLAGGPGSSARVPRPVTARPRWRVVRGTRREPPGRSLPDRVGGGRAAGVRTHIRPVGFGRPFASRTERVQSGAQPSSRTRLARSVLV